MNCQRINDECLLEALHDGALPPETSGAVRVHLETCATCRAQLAALEKITAQLPQLFTAAEAAAPGERMRANFQAMLAAERAGVAQTAKSASASSSEKKRNTGRLGSLRYAGIFPRRVIFQFGAALAFLAVGVFVGARFVGAIPPAPVASSDDSDTRRELAELRAQMNDMGKLVTYSLLQQKSTSERLQTVLATLQLKSPDRQLLADLVGTLALDPSVNVRLSAVEALAPHTDSDIVRAGLLAALPRETAPLVQVALIELIASTRDADAAFVFAQLARDDKTDATVRETARRALAYVSNRPQPAEPAPENDTLSHTQTTTKIAV